MEYDIIVIGAGIGGLTCAATLVKGGKRVLVCEQHSKLGGYVTSFERKDFIFDGGIQSFSSVGMVFPILKELGLLEKVKFAKDDYRIIAPNVNIKLNSIEGIISQLKKTFPEDSIGIEMYFKHLRGFIQSLKKITPKFYNIAIPLKRRKKIVSYLYLSVFHFDLVLNLIRYRKTTSYDLANKYISNEKLKFLLADRAPLIEMALWWHWWLEDYWYPIGGMQRFADNFATLIKEYGGTISLGTKVEKILIENGKAVGVRLEDGKELHSEFVVSNVDYRQTFTKLVGSEYLTKEFMQKIKKSKVSGSAFIVYLGTDFDGGTLEKQLGALHVFYYPSHNGKRGINDPDYFKDYPIGIFAPSLVDNSLTPEGKSIIILQASAPYNYMNQWQTKNGKRTKEYKELKEKVANQLITTAEKVIPNLSKHIIVKDVATPLTLERYTLNTEGSLVGWTWDPKYSFHKFLSGSIMTPIKNLLTAGHWTFSLGGLSTSMLTGKRVAETILDSTRQKKKKKDRK